MTGDPYPKSRQLARGEKRYHRKVASPKRWQQIINAKTGPCRCCGTDAGIQWHHLVDRVHGGSDTEANIVPVCGVCHPKVTRRLSAPCVRLLQSLTDAEYAYLIHHGGEDYPERRYGLDYGRAV